MKEIEVLFEVPNHSVEDLIARFSEYRFVGTLETTDEYFFNPGSGAFAPSESLRLTDSFRVRTKDGKNYIAVKKDHFLENDIWSYSDEYETEIGDADVMKHILHQLGFDQLVIIKNKKHTFISDEYEVVVEEVENLGVFIEVESLDQEAEDEDVTRIKLEIIELLKRKGITVTGELNMGKPELMLRKLRSR